MIDGSVAEALLEVQRALAGRDASHLTEALKSQLHEVRIAAAEALGEVGGDKAGLALLRVARDHPGERPDVRIAALRSLGGVYDRNRYATILEEFIKTDNRRVVAAARRRLSEIDPEGYPARLARNGCLDHGAIGVYGNSREESALPLLSEFLGDLVSSGRLSGTSYWGKAYAAVKALGKIGGDDAASALDSLISSIDSVETDVVFQQKRLLKLEDAARVSLARTR